MFDNFAYSGNVAASNMNVDFEIVGPEFHRILAPVTGTGFFTNLSLADRISVISGAAPNVPPAMYEMVEIKDQSNLSAPRSAGLLNTSNSPGPTDNLVPSSETGGPQFFAATIAVSASTDPAGVDGANPGLASPELVSIQAITAIPEPASLALIGAGLVCLGVLRKRVS